MKTVYLIKELCPMWNDGTGVDYKVIKPYVFIKQEETEECRLDYEYISCDRVLCTEYELISLNVDDDNVLKEINIESEKIKIKQIINGDYEEEFRYDIHPWEWLKSAGRLYFESDNSEDEAIRELEELDSLYSGSEMY